MKSNKTLFNLIIYIVVFSFAIYLIGNIMVYYYSNVKTQAEDMRVLSEFTKFDLYMLKAIKKEDTRIKKIGTVDNDESSYFITFQNEDGTTVSFIKKGNLIYYNEVKLCEKVDSFRIFIDRSEKENITVELIIGGEMRSFQYAMI